jgi:hypothetical protein
VCKDYQVNPSIKYEKSEKFNMSKIQINNLQAAGSELFESSESFLTELQATEAHAVYGGKNGSNKGSNRGNKGSNKGNKGSNKNNRNSGRTPIVFVPVYFPPYHC